MRWKPASGNNPDDCRIMLKAIHQAAGFYLITVTSLFIFSIWKNGSFTVWKNCGKVSATRDLAAIVGICRTRGPLRRSFSVRIVAETGRRRVLPVCENPTQEQQAAADRRKHHLCTCDAQSID